MAELLAVGQGRRGVDRRPTSGPIGGGECIIDVIVAPDSAPPIPQPIPPKGVKGSVAVAEFVTTAVGGFGRCFGR